MSSSSPAPSSIDYSVTPAPASTPAAFTDLIASQEAAAEDQDTLELKAALRVLWPILSPGTRTEYSTLMNPPLTSDMFRRRGLILRNLNGPE